MKLFPILIVLALLSSCTGKDQPFQNEKELLNELHEKADDVVSIIGGLDIAIAEDVSGQAEVLKSETGVGTDDLEEYSKLYETNLSDYKETGKEVDEAIEALKKQLITLREKQKEAIQPEAYDSIINQTVSLMNRYLDIRDDALPSLETQLARQSTRLESMQTQLNELDQLVADAEALLEALASQASSIERISGTKGEQGDQGPQGDQGEQGETGIGLTLQDANDLRNVVLGESYIDSSVSPQEYFSDLDSDFRLYQGRLQNLLDVLEDIEVGDSTDYMN